MGGLSCFDKPFVKIELMQDLPWLDTIPDATCYMREDRSCEKDAKDSPSDWNMNAVGRERDEPLGLAFLDSPVNSESAYQLQGSVTGYQDTCDGGHMSRPTGFPFSTTQQQQPDLQLELFRTPPWSGESSGDSLPIVSRPEFFTFLNLNPV